MAQNITQKILSAHLVEGRLETGQEIGIKIDQTLTQDATGTMAYLEFETLGLDRVKTEVSVSYVDHNLLQADFKNADDHRFLQSCASRFGLHFSRPGNGISHQVHLERFGVPGKTLLGSDSHTPAGGGLGMLAMGAGGMDVALAMAGYPFFLSTPAVLGVELTGRLPQWSSAKDVILEILRRLSVKGGVGKVLEYFGPGVATLSVTDRAVITHMGAELGATSSVFPSDEETRRFLSAQSRPVDWRPLAADPGAGYDAVMKVDLTQIEPMIACPSSPDNVKKVSEVAGTPVTQVIVGSSGNSSFRDLMMVAKIMAGRQVHPNVSLDINPGSRQALENVSFHDGLKDLIGSGARIHQSGCLGCIGMGQAPPTGGVSVRTFPRNFPGRSGTPNDLVYLSSPETAAAAAVFGRITSPTELGDYPVVTEPEKFIINNNLLIPPTDNNREVEIVRGPNIKPFPVFEAVPDELTLTVLAKVGDNITTDHIMPAGSAILPLRSNIPAISEFVFRDAAPGFAARAKATGDGLVIGGENYGQGSSREHAAIAPRYLGVRAKVVKSFARIHLANLCNMGILPFTFAAPGQYDLIQEGDKLIFKGLHDFLKSGAVDFTAGLEGKSGSLQISLRLAATGRDRGMLLAGGLLNLARIQAGK
ncbi:MAG: aconitate hydratase [Deltaproteobacteria bacterium]|nr:aconitate hydratase [Deltaproteobacteria bacterium]